jgi:hypothetical protein
MGLVSGGVSTEHPLQPHRTANQSCILVAFRAELQRGSPVAMGIGMEMSMVRSSLDHPSRRVPKVPVPPPQA